MALKTMDSGGLFYRQTQKPREKKAPCRALSSRPSGAPCLPWAPLPSPRGPPCTGAYTPPCCFPCEGLGSLLDLQWELPPASPTHHPTRLWTPKALWLQRLGHQASSLSHPFTSCVINSSDI